MRARLRRVPPSDRAALKHRLAIGVRVGSWQLNVAVWRKPR